MGINKEETSFYSLFSSYCSSFVFFNILYHFLLLSTLYELCLDPCIIYNDAFSMWEMIAHQSLPSVIIIVFSLALFVRVLRQQYRANQAIQWQKHQKMTVQVLSISFLYVVFIFPYVIYSFMLIYSVSDRQLRDFGEYAEVLSYFMTLLLPFTCFCRCLNFE